MTRNRLGSETSPYLRQHADNPVHWWAWGPEALAEAKRTNRPILLSIGYAACHWCHVMAHESFEDEATAAVMNELFVNIKVDREERPDIDAIYMGALHRLCEQGGWPLTMFLDADGRPFWGGTYFPKEAKFGRPPFVDVLRKVAEIYRDDAETVAHNASALMQLLQPAPPPSGRRIVTEEALADLVERMTTVVDRERGGIRGAPKFPQWSFFWLLWRGGIRYANDAAKEAVQTTLVNICQGGIYDHLGGGFARYAVDELWLVPHFEKMLYDNALLIDLLTEVWRETRNPLFETRIAETVAWLEREMIAEGGGFAASLDADSEGEEGKFYVWTLDEIREVLGPEDARVFAAAYDITQAGNFEGKNIPNRLQRGTSADAAFEEARLSDLRGRLLAAREKRVRPGWDDKVLADWNGLMIAALARAAVVFERPSWLALAERAFAFVQQQMAAGGGRLYHAARSGVAKAPATAADYANMIWAALRLHQATGTDEYLAAALTWTSVLDTYYWREGGGYYQSAEDTADVIVRLCSAQDDATPNANGVMVANMAALTLLTGEAVYLDRAATIFGAFVADAQRNLVGHTGLLASAIDLYAPQMIVLANGRGENAQALTRALHAVSLPGALEYLDVRHSSAPGLEGKAARNGEATAYACLGPQCSAPLGQAQELTRTLLANRQA